jgi:hypothetical protein
MTFLVTSPSGDRAVAQGFQANYDESKVPEYELPDPLIDREGEAVETVEHWQKGRRGEILKLFQEQVYGRVPERGIDPADVRAEVLAVEENALDGKAIRKQVRLHFTEEEHGPAMDLLIYIPTDARKPVPAFFALNFQGNHTVTDEDGVFVTESWVRNREGVSDHRASAERRGVASERWPIEMIVDRGYALVTAYYGDVDPDYDDGFQNGIHPYFYREGQEKPEPDQWGSIAAWAWGLSRGLDYLIEEPGIDGDRVAVMGHSRLGKTSLWAGASDPRFAMVISNNSGCGGAALSRREFGETVARINNSFPHWFCDNFVQYNQAVDRLPVDQHELIALIAPRPVYVASAEEDRWADPRGEFLSALHADPVYRLLGTDGIGDCREMPPVNQPVGEVIGYHVRTGKHDVTDYDWSRYLDFADRHMPEK